MAEKGAKIKSAMFALFKFAVNDWCLQMLVSERCKNLLLSLSAAQPLGKLLPETSSLLHLVTRLPPHKPNRLMSNQHGLTTGIQAILRVVKEQLDFLWCKVLLLCVHIRDNFLFDLFICRRRLVN